MIHDLSATGLLLESRTELAAGERLELNLPEWGAVEAEVVWHSGDFYGCRFQEPISTAAVSAARLRSAPRATGKAAADLLSEALDEVVELSCRVREISDRLDRTIDELVNRGS